MGFCSPRKPERQARSWLSTERSLKAGQSKSHGHMLPYMSLKTPHEHTHPDTHHSGQILVMCLRKMPPKICGILFLASCSGGVQGCNSNGVGHSEGKPRHDSKEKMWAMDAGRAVGVMTSVTGHELLLFQGASQRRLPAHSRCLVSTPALCQEAICPACYSFSGMRPFSRSELFQIKRLSLYPFVLGMCDCSSYTAHTGGI